MLISKFNNENAEKYIKEFEEKYSFTFPEQYRKFLLKYNGGRTPKTKFNVKRVASDVRAMYGFGEENEYYNFTGLEKAHILKGYLEKELVPIAENVFGDYILIGIGKENNGKVYFMYHDRGTKPKELTDDFATFVSKCKSEKIGHIRSVEERKEDLIRRGKGHNIGKGLINIWQEEIDLYSNMHQEELILD